MSTRPRHRDVENLFPDDFSNLALLIDHWPSSGGIGRILVKKFAKRPVLKFRRVDVSCTYILSDFYRSYIDSFVLNCFIVGIYDICWFLWLSGGCWMISSQFLICVYVVVCALKAYGLIVWKLANDLFTFWDWLKNIYCSYKIMLADVIRVRYIDTHAR